MRIIKRTEGIKCFIWHWITTYVRNNDVRVFYSWTSFLFFLCLLPFSQFHLGKCTWMPKSEQLGKSAKNKLGSWAAEKWQKSRLSSCLCLLFLRVLITQIVATAVSVFKRWAIKMLNFFSSHSDMMHVNIPKSEGWLDWEQLAWLGLTNTLKTHDHDQHVISCFFYSHKHSIMTRHIAALPGFMCGTISRQGAAIPWNLFWWHPSQEILWHLHTIHFFGGGYGLSKQSIVC